MAKLLSGTRVYGTATVDSQLIVAGTATSTSTLTGALLVSGGVGIRGDLYVAGTINGILTSVVNTASTVLTSARNNTATHFLTFVDSNNATGTAENLYTTSSVIINPGTGEVDILSTLASTSTTTGALVVTGGVGIRGDLWVGGIINGTIAGAGTAGIANTSTLVLTTSRNTTTVHFLTFVDSNNTTATGESLYTTSTISIIPSTGEVDILSALSSISTTTGALVVTGGIGLGRDLSLGGSLRFFNNNTSTIRAFTEVLDGVSGITFEGTRGRLLSITDTFTGTIFSVARDDGIPSIEVLDTGTVILNEYGGWTTIVSTTTATNSLTGALRVLGGVGIRGDLWVGGIINGTIAGAGSAGTANTSTLIITSATNSTATHFLTFVDSNNATGAAENLYTTSTIVINPNTGEVDILSALASTSTNTGALVVSGGVGIGGNLWVRGTINGNIGGGTTGTIFYQSAPGVTTGLSIATTAGWQLVSNGVIPVWTASGGLNISNDVASATAHYLTFVTTSTGPTTTIKTAATSGLVYQPSTGNVGVGTTALPIYKLEVNGSFAATTKSFLIEHPTKKGWRLRYGSLEGPENGVYLRGRLTGNNVINLPDYWLSLVDPESITVNLTPIGRDQNIYVKEILENTVIIGNSNVFNKEIDCYYTVFAERNDVEKLITEIPPNLNG